MLSEGDCDTREGSPGSRASVGLGRGPDLVLSAGGGGWGVGSFRAEQRQDVVYVRKSSVSLRVESGLVGTGPGLAQSPGSRSFRKERTVP